MIQAISDRAILTGRQAREKYPENYSMFMITNKHHDLFHMEAFVACIVDEEHEEIEARDLVLQDSSLLKYHYIWITGLNLNRHQTLGDVSVHLN